MWSKLLVLSVPLPFCIKFSLLIVLWDIYMLLIRAAEFRTSNVISIQAKSAFIRVRSADPVNPPRQNVLMLFVQPRNYSHAAPQPLIRTYDSPEEPQLWYLNIDFEHRTYVPLIHRIADLRDWETIVKI
ncbi:hypothetical protein B0H17DRAFT_1147267 [Mycena rosella]|uniref:Uncharacterized protein n=1 Tax=Mycena rosella TaxID=1033263 RepID=A0AAD7CM64_MYCRO|nr:hypothetical protein B0H17DRAFT_1147267 [Mycena rosella]